jgi:hypothetical protein
LKISQEGERKVFCGKQFLSYIIGFFYALFIGNWLITLVLARITSISNMVFQPKELDRVKITCNEGWRLDYQPKLMGLIERTLFMSALLFNRGEFIAVWLGLKVAGGWKRWQDEKLGRYLYSSSLFGSGLSVLYALVGFMLARGLTWKLQDLYGYPVLAALALILATVILWIWLKRYTGKRN